MSEIVRVAKASVDIPGFRLSVRVESLDGDNLTSLELCKIRSKLGDLSDSVVDSVNVSNIEW